jgi:ATP-dependent DNA helicase RecQ
MEHRNPEAAAAGASDQARIPVAFTALLERAESATREAFGFDRLRPHQAEVLHHVLAGRDCLAVLPTGSGKSLCYALPALVREGLVLVVSPLIALIRDQYRKLASHGVPCAALDSLQTPEEKDQVFRRLAAGELRLLLVSPERLARPDFRARLKALPLQLVAVDEAHCVSHWGNHFRPDYRFLGDYLADFGPVQKLAVTATATQRVREDIARALRLAEPATVWADFARGNLRLKVVRADKVNEQLSSVLQATLGVPGNGIIYTPTRRHARDVHRMLVDAGVKAAVYHAGMGPAARDASQRAFVGGSVRVVVATHAFGLGIDKGDIRFVHHAGLPGSIEQYVQEVGRAGRDGLPATCCLIYGPRDYYIQKFMIDKSYPEVQLLQSVLAESCRFLAGSAGQTPHALARHLADTLAAEDEELTEALRILCREGLLLRLKAQGSALGDDSADALIAEGRLDEAPEIFREYPLRKLDTMAKLDAMRAFVALSGDRTQFLDDYFRK